MSKTSLKSMLAASAFLAASAASGVQAQEATMEQVTQYAAEGAAMGQVTSVSQLRDVRPTDWAFQALQSLVERYGCIAGYPDGTFRGNRAMTRYEFAAGLNACLDRVNELIASATADLVTQEDLAVLQRLQEEFQAELATLRGRVDALEARTAELEANQFSTTTKLKGQVIFDAGSVFAGSIEDVVPTGVFLTENTDGVELGEENLVEVLDDAEAESDITFGGRVRLALNTSFTGRDLLRTRLQAGRMGNYEDRFEGGIEVPEAAIAWNGSSNDVILNELYYNFPVGRASVYVGTRGLDPDDVVPTLGTFADSTLLDFLEDNQLSYDSGSSGAGAAVSYQLTDSINATAGYFTNTGSATSPGAADPGSDSGFFGSSNQYFGQLTFEPTDKIVIAGTYARSYDAGAADSFSISNSFGINAGYAISPKLTLSGWAGWKDENAENGFGPDKDLVNWAAILGFPDLFREGNYGSIAVGEPPNNDELADNISAQAIYKMQVSDNISIQPGLAWISNPLGDDDNDSVWIGNVRTVFSF